MIKVRGRCTGENIVLLDPISLPPNAEVEILIPDIQSDVQEQLYEEAFVPVSISGKPLSETIIEERR